MREYILNYAKECFNNYTFLSKDVGEIAYEYCKELTQNRKSEIKYRADYKQLIIEKKEIIRVYLSCYTVGDSFLKESTELDLDENNIMQINSIIFDAVKNIRSMYIDKFNKYYNYKRLVFVNNTKEEECECQNN